VTRWSSATGGGSGREYAARFDALVAQGTDVHGEASCCTALAPPPSRVLDAGCGTGRVAIRLAELGHDVMGVDLDASMLEVARERAPQLRWEQADLAALDLVGHGEVPYDLVVMAGNIVPLVAEGTEPLVVERVAAQLAPGGLLVAGFGLDHAHLPPAGAIVDITAYDRWCAAVGLQPLRRLATWDGQPWTPDAGYAVSVHQRPAAVTSAG
jgi:SAM-dependent methyltransferase